MKKKAPQNVMVSMEGSVIIIIAKMKTARKDLLRMLVIHQATRNIILFKLLNKEKKHERINKEIH